MPIRVGSALLWGYIAAGLMALGAHAQTAPKLSITLTKVPSNTAGDRSVQVRTEIRNISQSNVVLMVAAPQADFTLSVIGPDGKRHLRHSWARNYVLSLSLEAMS